MSNTQIVAEDWLNENQFGLITCPYQPGGLLISKRACMKRHMAAPLEKVQRKSDDLFEHKVNKGLALCRTCPIGEKLVRFVSMA